MNVGAGRGVVVRRTIRAACALVAASGAAAGAFALMSFDFRVFPYAFVLIAIVAAVLGLPIYGMARAAKRDSPLVACVAGFCVGAAIPAALILFGPSADQASVGGVPTVINGSYTAAGWLQNLIVVGGFGLLGTFGGFLFWLAVLDKADDGDAPPQRRPFRDGSVAAIALLSIAATFAIPWSTKDQSCHNPLRGGEDSIGTVASFAMKTSPDEWREIEAIVQQFATQRGWSLTSDLRPDDSFRWFQMSLCREPGTNISVNAIPETSRVYFGVYQPQGGSSWIEPFQALHALIKKRWPSRIEYTGENGERIDPPAWAKESLAETRQ